MTLLFFVQSAFSHNKINEKAEMLWGRKGIIAFLTSAGIERNVQSSGFKKFISAKGVKIVEDRNYFFENSYNDLDSLEQWLDQKNKEYELSLDSFLLGTLKLVDKNDEMNASSGVSTTICDNIGFESGTSLSDFNSNWILKKGFACGGYGCIGFSPVTVTSLIPADNLTTQYSITSSGYDPNIGNGSNILPTVKPGSTYSFRLENYTNGGDAMLLTRTIAVDASLPFYKYSFAAVLEDPGTSHPDDYKPYFHVVIRNSAGAEIVCTNYFVIANPASAEVKENFIFDNSSGNDLYYRDWTDVVIPLNDYIGQNVTVEFMVSDCAWGGHMAYVYLDGDCLSGNINSGNCISLSDPTRYLTAPPDFNGYWWNGPGILGSNSKQVIRVVSAGIYEATMTTRGGCEVKLSSTVSACSTSLTNCSISVSDIQASSCSDQSNTYTLSGNIILSSGFLSSGTIGLTVGNITKYFYGPFSSSFAFSLPNIYTFGGTVNYTVKYYSDNFIGEAKCTVAGTFTSPSPCLEMNLSCENCIGSFKPEIGKTYIVSAWVKDVNASPQTGTFTNPYIEISYNSGATVLSPIYASGRIIEGWQRVYFEFTIPSGTTEISIALKTNSGTADFDDIRVHPIDAGFTSYVYDPISLKLLAVLDDNNYATFYEYDNEGTLIRTKKETESGVVTITESRENNPKR